jgi:GR25 family glycosyltransferase involved in LPS biosynthesis
MLSITDITNIKYINLDSRPDRKTHIESQLASVGFSAYERFKAIKTSNGAIGCTMSHLKCLMEAREKGLSHLLVCEDDTTFLQPEVFKRQLNAFLQKQHPWDVVLIAGNNVLPYQHVDETCIKVSHCQTTTCYLVQGHYFTTLIDNINSGLRLLMQNPANRFYYAIDKYWLQLQKQDKWYLIIPLTVIQQEGYSDIEHKVMNYAGLMTNVHKVIVPTPIPSVADNVNPNHMMKNIVRKKHF